MGYIKRRRLSQIFQYGWKDAGEISKHYDVNKSRISLFFDILSCFCKFYIFSNQYKSKQIWKLNDKERLSILTTLGNNNKKKDEWLELHYSDWNFICKYASFKWQKTPSRINKRQEAYRKHYGYGGNVHIQYGVTIVCEHYSVGKITCGKNVLFARNVDIDYTGDLSFENGVKLSEGVKILTHDHNLDFNQRDSLRHGLIKTPLIIRDNVGIGAHALIMPGVSEIGRRAMISSNAVVKRQVPPYAIVMGNPARIVGFRYSPAIIAEFEEENYPEEERIPLEVLEENYKKYYLSKLSEIKAFLG